MLTFPHLTATRRRPEPSAKAQPIHNAGLNHLRGAMPASIYESPTKPYIIRASKTAHAGRCEQSGSRVRRGGRRADHGRPAASGAYLWDEDGNRYIDYVSSWGPLIFGHAHPHVVEAVVAAAGKGTSFGAPTRAENELAQLIVEAVPSIEKVRLVSSGTEATMSAIRLARGFTGRDMIVKFAGNYHGHVDSLLVAAGSSAATLAVPNSPGVTAGTSRDTLVLQYNDVAGLRDAFAAHGPRIAGVIFEPVVGNMGVVVPSSKFLVELRKLTRQAGTLLICDEVMTGFRVAYGGAQERFGIEPDLTTLGKIVGGGLPVGAYGGRSDVMDHVLPAGKVFQAGTLSGNPLATAAGIAMLRLLRDEPPYERLEQLSARLAAGLSEAAAKRRAFRTSWPASAA